MAVGDWPAGIFTQLGWVLSLSGSKQGRVIPNLAQLENGTNTVDRLTCPLGWCLDAEIAATPPNRCIDCRWQS